MSDTESNVGVVPDIVLIPCVSCGSPDLNIGRYWISCDNCGVSTARHSTLEYAKFAWNNGEVYPEEEEDYMYIGEYYAD